MKLGDAGTIDRFDLVFPYQILKRTEKKNRQKQFQIKNTVYMRKG